jgi:hypothetical protein
MLQADAVLRFSADFASGLMLGKDSTSLSQPPLTPAIHPWPWRSGEALTLEVGHTKKENANVTGHFSGGPGNFPFHLGLHPVVNLLKVHARVASQNSGPGPVRLFQRCNKAGFYPQL